MSPGERIRARRRALGLGLGELAARVGITRQALMAIERGASLPRVDTALRLATALELTVEDLFAGPPAAPPLLPARSARIGGRLVTWPLAAEEAFQDLLPVPDDLPGARGGSAPAATPRSLDLVIAGCDPFSGWLKAVLEARHPHLNVLLRNLGSRPALEALAAGETHVAGVHAGTATANHALAKSVLGNRPFVLIGWIGWEAGIVWHGRRRRSLGDARVVVAREAGTSARALLEEAARGDGLDPESLLARAPVARGHVMLSQLVAGLPGAAGVTCEPVARLVGLPFTPLREESYQFCVTLERLSDPQLAALLETLQGVDWRPLEPIGLDARAVGSVGSDRPA